MANGTEALDTFTNISAGNCANSTMLYQTDGKGTQKLTSDAQKKALARVTFSADSHVVVELDSAWGSGTSRIKSREIVIVLGDVTAPIPRDLPSVDAGRDGSEDTFAANDIPYMGYPFPSSSMIQKRYAASVKRYRRTPLSELVIFLEPAPSTLSLTTTIISKGGYSFACQSVRR